MITNRVEELRQELRNLCESYGRGDIPKKKLDRLQAEKGVKLCRAIVNSQLAEDEKILEEHHVVHAHMKLNQSLLKEPEEAAISLFLTDRRLLRLRSTKVADQPVTCDASDNTVIDDIRLDNVVNLRLRKERRLGEAIAGAVICTVAFLFRSWLLVTGTLMFGLGVLGILHGLLMPTKWIDIEVDGDLHPDDIMKLYGLRKKSARRLAQALRKRILASHNASEL